MNIGKTNIDFVGKSKIWFSISIVLSCVWIIAMIVQSVRTGFPLRRGIDFTGGSIIQLQFDNWPADKKAGDFAAQVESIVSKYTVKQPSVQTSIQSANGQNNLILVIRADSSLLANPDAQKNLYVEIENAGGEFSVLEESEVGALMGKELTSKAIWGVIIGNCLILLFITFRLSFDFAVFAIVGLIHDLLVVAGIFALFNLEINSSFVAVLLTVVGYSINDTIIIYDRIRENMKLKRHLTFDKLVNSSLNETLARSINTTVTTVLAILALLIFGGESIKTFMVGLAAGITTGAYSSIFICSMLLVAWRLRGKGPVVIEDVRPKDTASIILEPDTYQDDEDEEELAGEPVEEIKVEQLKKKPASGKRPKRRKRRY